MAKKRKKGESPVYPESVATMTDKQLFDLSDDTIK